MRPLPSSSYMAHRTRWGTRILVGTAFVGGILALAPTASAAPDADSAAPPPAFPAQAQSDPHVQQEVLDLVVGALREIRANGALDDLAGPQSRIVSCLVGTIGATDTADGPTGALSRLIPCLAPIDDIDPTVLPRLVSSMDVATLASTLAAAETPHDPATPHTSSRGHAAVPPGRSNAEPSTEQPTAQGTQDTQDTQDPESAADPSTPELPALEPDATVPETSAPGTSSETTTPETTTPEAGDHPSAAPQSPTGTTGSSNGKYRAPTTGTLTSTFGDGRAHQGIDIANSTGTPIVAVADGEVISAGPAQGFGLWVRIRHDDGTVTTYGHNNDNLVTVGQRVTAGEEIATVGNRGISTGPHLHFEVDTPAGNKVDPRLWLAERGATITGSDRDS
ncbi:peptidoglycan DD-metalloendopeptidase family protein [Antrihabitans spumae]|uniref:Peptidoglycan DD-metalloendopeptidase family protein n=1 Tax=Antrihabitans spumae TaxID=3373370 RepID=A0ABW7K2P7_9NOCA